MLLEATDDPAGKVVLAHGAIEPEDVAEAVIAGPGRGAVPDPPAPGGADYVRRKAADPDRWLGGMRRLQNQVLEAMHRRPDDA